ncbi:MAG: hypothetical protein K9J76_04240 [Polaromonas sp.]|nr:hypothetical protein [Polaromonas sp.]
MLTQTIHRSSLAAFMTLLLVGCATSTSHVEVPINVLQAIPHAKEAPRRAQVQVTDIRKDLNLERTSIGGVSMGRTTLKPPEIELVQKLVEMKADEVLLRRGETEPQTVLCGIRVFMIATPATVVYWDINTTIELVLRVRGQDRTVSGAATERTFIWPSDEIIQRVTTEALRQSGEDAGRALTELFALPH